MHRDSPVTCKSQLFVHWCAIYEQLGFRVIVVRVEIKIQIGNWFQGHIWKAISSKIRFCGASMMILLAFGKVKTTGRVFCAQCEFRLLLMFAYPHVFGLSVLPSFFSLDRRCHSIVDVRICKYCKVLGFKCALYFFFLYF